MCKKFKNILVILGLLIYANSVFAVDAYVSDIYKKIDAAFLNHSSTELDRILSNNNDDKNYYLMEHYTEKKIRRLILKEEYDFAMDAIVVVIDNNLDNEEAVEMYNVIYESYELQKDYAIEQARAKEYELARIEKAKESKRDDVDKEYISANKAGGGSVYVAGKENKLSSHKWKASLGLVDLILLNEPKNSINSLHYGISLDFDYIYMMEKLNLGFDAFAALNFLGFTENPEEKLVPLLGEFEIIPKISINSLWKNLFFKAGFGAILTGETSKAPLTKSICETLLTPIVGVEVAQIPIGPTKLDFGVDWYAGHLFKEDLNLALGAGVNLEIPFAEFEKIKLNFNVGLRDKILWKDTGLENRGSLTLAIGVGNVTK